VAQLGYWHHGLWMGPRMVNESAPAWCVLAVLAAGALVRRVPERAAIATDYSPRVLLASGFTLALLSGLLVFAPLRLASYRQRPAAFLAARAAQQPALIFVHGGWTSRLAMRMAAAGMRLDSVETALRQNATCQVQTWFDARSAGRPVAGLDFVPRATGQPAAIEISPGNRIRMRAQEQLSGSCAREAAADRLGTLDVSPLLWRGDLPGLAPAGPLFLRDLGPAANARVLSQYPQRKAYVLLTPTPEAPPQLADYERAMALLWGREGA
jgi:hypothetical protein